MAESVKNSQKELTNDGTQPALSNKLQETRVEVDAVFKIMQNNVAKVLERDEKLHELDEKADSLLIGTSQFHSKAVQMKRKMWWKNMKMKIILGSVGVFLFVLIVYWIIEK